jgi:hypothetical protein
MIEMWQVGKRTLEGSDAASRERNCRRELPGQAERLAELGLKLVPEVVEVLALAASFRGLKRPTRVML